MRRQSTMTQLVDGRRPLPDDDEPEFQPVKRTLSRSGSGGKSTKGQAKDKQQRTLTQMVAGLGSFMAPSDEDTSDETENAEGSTVYNNILAEHFANRAVSQPRAATEDAGVNVTEQPALPTSTGPTEDYGGRDSEDAYEPTQNIQAPDPRERRSSRRERELKQPAPSSLVSSPSRQKQGRFGLLTTPEKRRILEIPSSQSPPDAPLSTQITPATLHSLSRPYARTSREVQGTPSRPRRVAFAEFTTSADTRTSPKLRFTGTIQDSEDDDNLDEDDDESETEFGIGEETQAFIHGIHNVLEGQDIGVETQAMLQSTDNAFGERAGSAIPAVQRPNSSVARMTHGSGAAGPCDVEQASSGNTTEEQKSSNRAKTASIQNTGSKTQHESSEEAEFARPLLPASIPQPITIASKEGSHLASDEATEAPAQIQQRLNMFTQTASSIVVKDEPNEKEVDETVSLPPTPQAPLCPASSALRLDDLDHDPPEFRHPTPRMSTTQDTAQSHSSRAEEQLQSEWLSYSQYPRRLPTSSMHVAHNGNSYQANAFSDPGTRQLLSPQCTAPLSQATTVDGTQRSPYSTPKKSRHTSSNTTPRKVHESLPLGSPTKPPSLVIPSSFPSPSKGSWRNLSSPVLGSSPLEPYESIEDFSIPPLPPPGSSPLFPMDDDVQD